MQSKTLTRRRHSRELKAQVLEQCAQPGASVAAIALAHGLNANLVHKWRRHWQAHTPALSSQAQFISLPLAPNVVPAASDNIRIEVQHGAATVHLTWPVSAAGECAQWLREVLR
jgi:transposase